MNTFIMEIAGHTAEVTALFDSTPHQFSRYLSHRAPEFSITVTEEDLRFEQNELDAEALQEGFRRRRFTDPFLERAAIQRKFAEYLWEHRILLLHGSTVAVDGKAYLFTAKSGTGKSTHTRLWRETFGSRAVMINDDKPFLEIADSGVLAHGSPWSGKHGLDTNTAAPLDGICLLERGAENRIRQAAPEELMPMLLHESYCPQNPEKASAHIALVKRLAATVPLWHLYCTTEPEAAVLSHSAMSRKPG